MPGKEGRSSHVGRHGNASLAAYWEVSRPTLAVSPKFQRRIVLPLEGKGDRSAVDEVTCRPAPLRGASTPHSSLLTPHSFSLFMR